MREWQRILLDVTRSTAGIFLLLLVTAPFTKADQTSKADQTPKVDQAVTTGYTHPVYIAIILDDLGNNYNRDLRALRLPAPVTYSILPYSTHATRLAQTVHNSGKEVMVHLPMQNLHDMPIGPGGLTNDLTHPEFKLAVSEAISRVPHATGINNHMGSFLTQKSRPMEWLMEEIKSKQLFFVDSRTTHKTVASRVAKNKNLFTSSRDVFLDNDRSIYAIHTQFRKLIDLAKIKGTGIAIGHPYQETLTYLEMAIPHLQQEGIKIIPVSNLIAIQQPYNLLLANGMASASSTGSE